MQQRQIRANFDATTIRVYQAYPAEIAKPALSAGTFVSPFKMERMTWIKPSFCWMMYRCGFAAKPGQEMVLGIDIKREGFEWALENAVISHFDPEWHSDHDSWKRSVETTAVRIQWDPERDIHLEKIDGVRSLQVGLKGEAVRRYVDDWIVGIEDLTPLVHSVALAGNEKREVMQTPEKSERHYPLPPGLSQIIFATK